MEIVDLINKIDELHQKMNRFEERVQDRNDSSIIVHIDVKDIHLQELNLEELAFHLDKLDIKELSGMLNLGNTFSPVNQTKGKPESTPSPKKNPNKKQTDVKQSDDIKVIINGKPVSYTIS